MLPRRSAPLSSLFAPVLLPLLLLLLLLVQIPTFCLVEASTAKDNVGVFDFAITGHREQYNDNGANDHHQQQHLEEENPSEFVFERFQSPTTIQNALKNIGRRHRGRRNNNKNKSPLFKWYEGTDGRKGYVSSTKLRKGDWVLAQSKQVAFQCTTQEVLQAYLSGDLQQEWNQKDVLDCTFHEIDEQEMPTAATPILPEPTGTTTASTTRRRIKVHPFGASPRGFFASSSARQRSIRIVGGGIVSTSDATTSGTSTGNLMQKLGSRISAGFHNNNNNNNNKVEEDTATRDTNPKAPAAIPKLGGHVHPIKRTLGKLYRQDLVLKSQRIIRSHTGIMRYSQIITIDQIGDDKYSVLVNLLEDDPRNNHGTTVTTTATTTKKKPFNTLRVYVGLQQNGNNVDIYAAGLMKVNRMVVPNLIVFDASGIAGGMAGKGTLWLAAYFDQRYQQQQQQQQQSPGKENNNQSSLMIG